MNILKTIRNIVVARLDPQPGITPDPLEAPEPSPGGDVTPYPDPRHPVERAFVEQMSSEDELGRVRRQRDEYFHLIESMERERDGMWTLYRAEVSEHLNAQALLERRVMESRAQLARALAMLNKMREEKELPPIESPPDLEPYEGEPVGTARAYAEAMIDFCKKFPEMIDEAKPKFVDGAKERERVAAADD